MGKVAGEDVAEIARGNREADLVADLERLGLLPGQGEVRVEVVDGLGQDARPVDRVDGAELERRVDVRVGEQRLDDVLQQGMSTTMGILGCARLEHTHLTVVKVSSHSQVVDVGVKHCRHL